MQYNHNHSTEMNLPNDEILYFDISITKFTSLVHYLCCLHIQNISPSYMSELPYIKGVTPFQKKEKKKKEALLTK